MSQHNSRVNWKKVAAIACGMALAPWEWRQGDHGKAIRYTNFSLETVVDCIAAMK